MARARRQERGARIYIAGHFLEKFPETEPHDDKLTEKALHVMYPMYVLKECRASFILGGQPPHQPQLRLRKQTQSHMKPRQLGTLGTILQGSEGQ